MILAEYSGERILNRHSYGQSRAEEADKDKLDNSVMFWERVMQPTPYKDSRQDTGGNQEGQRYKRIQWGIRLKARRTKYPLARDSTV